MLSGMGHLPSWNPSASILLAQCTGGNQVRSREVPDRHEFMSSEAKCLWLGWGRGHLSCLQHAAGMATHLGDWTHGLCGLCTSCSGSRIHQILSHLIQPPGWLWEQRTVRQAESCVGSHEKCQAWASPLSCPLTAVEPQTKIFPAWMSDSVLHRRLYFVIFLGGKELEGKMFVSQWGLLMASFMKSESQAQPNPKHKLHDQTWGLPLCYTGASSNWINPQISFPGEDGQCGGLQKESNRVSFQWSALPGSEGSSYCHLAHPENLSNNCLQGYGV